MYNVSMDFLTFTHSAITTNNLVEWSSHDYCDNIVAGSQETPHQGSCM